MRREPVPPLSRKANAALTRRKRDTNFHEFARLMGAVRHAVSPRKALMHRATTPRLHGLYGVDEKVCVIGA